MISSNPKPINKPSPLARVRFISKQIRMWNESVFYLPAHSRKVLIELPDKEGLDCPGRLGAADTHKNELSRAGLAETPVQSVMVTKLDRVVATDAGEISEVIGRWDNNQILAMWGDE